MITREQLLAILPYAKQKVDLFLAPLNDAMNEFNINTPKRQAAFIAQIGHESGQFKYVQEISSGSLYEGRGDLGNTQQGDGIKYKGRGLIQVTGRRNYTSVMLALNIDCLMRPELLEQPVNACRSAAWWWNTKGLNMLAEEATEDSFKKITKVINGGYTGLAERMALYSIAKKVLKC